MTAAVSLDEGGEVCIFCLTHRSRGNACTYGLGHEYPNDKKAPLPKQVAKPDKQLCSKCGLHRRNPASAASACGHEYPS